MFHIGKSEFNLRSIVLQSHLCLPPHNSYKLGHLFHLKKRIGIHTFYYVSNGKNRKWLISISNVFEQPDQTYGFYQYNNNSHFIPNFECILIPTFFYHTFYDIKFIGVCEFFNFISINEIIINSSGFSALPNEPGYNEDINSIEIMNRYSYIIDDLCA